MTRVRVLILACVLFCPFGVANETWEASVRVERDRILCPLNREIFGLSLCAWSSAQAVYDASSQTFRPQVLEALREMRPTCLRFPGGGHGSTYHWGEGIGTDRGGAGSQNAFGTDEFLALCEELGAEPVITVNWKSGNPGEAGRWVEYCNGSAETPMGSRRAENGHPEPYCVLRWEISNEAWSEARVTEYAQTIDAYATAMRRADPAIRLGVSAWHEPAWMNRYHPDTLPWNETLLRLAGEHIDFLIIHSYAWVDDKPKKADTEFVEAVLSYPNRLSEWLNANDLLLRNAGCPQIGFWFTEHNGYYGEKGMSPLLCQAFNGVLTARMLMEYARHGVDLACYWNACTDGWDHFSAISIPDLNPAHFQRRPAYYIYRLCGEILGGHVLGVSVNAPTYSSLRVGIIPGGDENPYLDALATLREDGKVGLLLANSSAGKPLSTHIECDAALVERCLVFQGEDPQSNRLGLTELAVTVEGSGIFTCVLPPTSVGGILLSF